MKEVCGYEGLDGKLYKTKKSCKIADLDYKIQDVERILHNFNVHLGDVFRRHLNSKAQNDFLRNQNIILNIVAEAVLRDSDNFIKIINKKKELEKELDELQKIRKNTWWLKIKWW